MKVSLEWISDFVELPSDVGPAAVADELTLKTVEVEDVVHTDGDVVFDIDNKSLTNRPDLWGHYGIARELAAIYGLPLKPLGTSVRPPHVEGLVGTLDLALCTRFAAVEFEVDADVPTPAWIRRRLARIGEAGINLCVDLSNYVMFTVGQPTHVYDADQLKFPLSAEIADTDVRLELLTGQVAELAGAAPVIRDGAEAVAFAGVMGGASSAVQSASRRFVLEAATFRPQPIRRASQRLGLRTEASARYEKGLDTQRVDLAVDLFLQLLRQAAPQASVTAMQDVTHEPTVGASITVDRAFLDRRIGQQLDDGEIKGTLQTLGFATAIDGATLRVTAPSWRSTGDVSLPHDVLEEIARIRGYDRLATDRISISLAPVRSLNRRPLDRVVREQLAVRAGLQEVITYPWTTDDLLVATGYDKERTVRFDGAPAPDRDSLRPSLIPNLLEATAANLRYRPAFGIFEVGTVVPGKDRVEYRGVYELMPPQTTMLGVALVGGDGVELFRRAKGMLEMLCRHCHLTDLSLTGDSDVEWADPSARLAIGVDGDQVGTFGLLTPRTRRLAGIGTVQVACVEVDLTRLIAHRSRENRFERLPDLPEADFDLSVVIADDIPWARVEATVLGAHGFVTAVSYVDEYRGSWVPEGHRSLTLRVTLRPRGTTLTSEDIGGVRSGVLDLLAQELSAHLR